MELEAKTRGIMIRGFFRRLEEGAGASHSQQGTVPPDAEDSALAKELLDLRRMLLGLLKEELEEAQEEWHIYAKQHVEITPALRGALYAPGPEDRPLLREQALVDGLLVRKYRLFIEMQRERRRVEAEEGEVEWDWASLGLMEGESEARRGAEGACGQAALPERSSGAGSSEADGK